MAVQSAGKVPDLKLMTSEQMIFWLGRFVIEVQKWGGKENPAWSIYPILCGFLRFLKESGVYDKKFLDENNGIFSEFRKLVEARMKSLIDNRFGYSLWQEDPILYKDEETLWQSMCLERKVRTAAVFFSFTHAKSLELEDTTRTTTYSVSSSREGPGIPTKAA